MSNVLFFATVLLVVFCTLLPTMVESRNDNEEGFLERIRRDASQESAAIGLAITNLVLIVVISIFGLLMCLGVISLTIN